MLRRAPQRSERAPKAREQLAPVPRAHQAHLEVQMDMLRMAVDLGHDVAAGQEIAQVIDVFGQTVERITAPVAGFVLRVMRLGSIATGAEVVWIAS